MDWTNYTTQIIHYMFINKTNHPKIKLKIFVARTKTIKKI